LIGLDLDGTLAQYTGNPDEIGPPYDGAVEFVRHLADRGGEPFILTARCGFEGGKEAVEGWLKEHGFPRMEVTDEKPPEMSVLLDDRAVAADPSMFANPGLADRLLTHTPHWLGKSEGNHAVFYHGTSTANAANIRRVGLRPTSSAKSYGVLTDSFHQAREYARRSGPDPAVVEFRIPHHEVAGHVGPGERFTVSTESGESVGGTAFPLRRSYLHQRFVHAIHSGDDLAKSEVHEHTRQGKNGPVTVHAYEKADHWTSAKIGESGSEGHPLNAPGHFEASEGGWRKDENNQAWWVKRDKSSEDRMRAEAVANELYRRAGVKVPEGKLVSIGGKLHYASKAIPGAQQAPIQDMKHHPDLWRGKAADVWLNNTDVFGNAGAALKNATAGNVMKKPDGSMVRIDHGGSLQFSGMMSTNKPFFHDGEGMAPKSMTMESAHDPQYQPVGAQVYPGSLSPGNTKAGKAYHEGIKAVADVKPEHIREAVGKARFDPKTASKVYRTLLARQKVVSAYHEKYLGKSLALMFRRALTLSLLIAICGCSAYEWKCGPTIHPFADARQWPEPVCRNGP
jgi:hypothetical protein